CVSFSCLRDHRDLPSFPTRRSSDLFRSSPAAYRNSSSFLPAGPIKGFPSRASILPGLSPTIIIFAGLGPTAGTFIIFPITQAYRSEEHTSELQSRENLVCRLLLEKK